MRPALVALLLAGCTARVSALESLDAAAVVSTCERAFEAGLIGARCEPGLSCTRPVDACCWDVALCVDRRWQQPVEVCAEQCEPCAGDEDCAWGAICDGGRCRGCPIADVDAQCGACEAPFVRSPPRHGCARCECMHRSTCDETTSCGAANDACYVGSVCLDACDGPQCCVRHCAITGCPARTPLGCRMVCPSDVRCPFGCVAIACRCTPDGAWDCGADCAPQDTPARCVFP